MFSCELCEIFKNTFFTEHFWATASCALPEKFGDNSFACFATTY